MNYYKSLVVVVVVVKQLLDRQFEDVSFASVDDIVSILGPDPSVVPGLTALLLLHVVGMLCRQCWCRCCRHRQL